MRELLTSPRGLLTLALLLVLVAALGCLAVVEAGRTPGAMGTSAEVDGGNRPAAAILTGIIVTSGNAIYTKTSTGWSSSSGPSGASNIRGVAKRPDGSLGVWDHGTGKVTYGSGWGSSFNGPSGCNCFGIYFNGSGHVYLAHQGTTGSIRKSTDSGANWTTIAAPSGATRPRDMAEYQESTNTKTLYLLDRQTNKVYASADDGATWDAGKSVPSTATNVRGIAVDQDTGDLYLSDRGTLKIFMSSDGGSTWDAGTAINDTNITNPFGLALPIHTLANIPTPTPLPTATPTPSPCGGTLTAGQDTVSRGESTTVTLAVTQGTLDGVPAWTTTAGTLFATGNNLSRRIEAPFSGSGSITITAAFDCDGWKSTASVTIDVAYAAPTATPTPTPTPLACPGSSIAIGITDRILNGQSAPLTLSVPGGGVTGTVTWAASAGTLSAQSNMGAVLTAPASGSGSITVTAVVNCGFDDATLTATVPYGPPPPTPTPTPTPTPVPTPTPDPDGDAWLAINLPEPHDPAAVRWYTGEGMDHVLQLNGRCDPDGATGDGCLVTCFDVMCSADPETAVYAGALIDARATRLTQDASITISSKRSGDVVRTYDLPATRLGKGDLRGLAASGPGDEWLINALCGVAAAIALIAVGWIARGPSLPVFIVGGCAAPLVSYGMAAMGIGGAGAYWLATIEVVLIVAIGYAASALSRA